MSLIKELVQLNEREIHTYHFSKNGVLLTVNAASEAEAKLRVQDAIHALEDHDGIELGEGVFLEELPRRNYNIEKESK